MSEKDNGYICGMDMAAAGEDRIVAMSRQAIFCSDCGAPRRTEVISGDEIYIVFDKGPICFHFSGGCLCGKRLEWHSGEQKLERLIRRRLKKKRGIVFAYKQI